MWPNLAQTLIQGGTLRECQAVPREGCRTLQHPKKKKKKRERQRERERKKERKKETSKERKNDRNADRIGLGKVLLKIV